MRSIINTSSTLKDDSPAMLTTIDNPYDPFTQWDEWLKYDRDQGYYTNEYLASLLPDDESFSFNQSLQSIEKAMEYIVETNPTGLWVIKYKTTNKEKHASNRESSEK